MKKGKFSQSITKFSGKSDSVIPVIIDVELVNSLIGDEENKAPSVAAVNKALLEKITEEQAKQIIEEELESIKIPEQVQADWKQNSIDSKDYIKNKPSINAGEGECSTTQGINTYAGCRAFKIKDVQPRGYNLTVINMTITIEDGEDISNIAIDDICSIIVNKNYMNFGKIISINYDNNTIVVNEYPSDLDSNTINTALDGNCYFFISKKPSIGTHLLDAGQHAEGINTTALLYGAHAEGYDSIAGGRYSHAEGDNTYSGYSAHSEGQNTNASGNVSHAEGSNTVASGIASHAEGQNTTASYYQAHAEGFNTKATAARAHAEGNGSEANEESAHAEGYFTKASGLYSHSEGKSSNSSGIASHAEGNNTIASGDYAHAEGSRDGAAYKGAEGKYSHSEGIGTSATNIGSHAEGGYTTASGDKSHAEGNGTTASGAHSHAEGTSTKASSARAHAEGFGSVAKNDSAHAEGYYTEASGYYSHAEGQKFDNTPTVAQGNGSHAEGQGTQATIDAAHSEGRKTIASGAGSHAEGNLTEAKSNWSHAEGVGTIASNEAQHVQGKYNEEDANCAHIVGWGSSGARKNIHTLSTTGNGWFRGKVLIGGNSPEDGKEVTTKEYVDGMQIVADIDSSTYVMTISLLNKNNEIIKATNVDLPLEEMIVDGRASEDGKNIILTLKNGNEVSFGIENIVNGLASTTYVDEGLSKKLDSVTQSYVVYCTGSEGAPKTRALSAYGTTDMAVPYFANPNNTVQFPLDVNPTHTIGVSEPVRHYHPATKQYVDNLVGNIEATLDAIIELQNSLIGGDE